MKKPPPLTWNAFENLMTTTFRPIGHQFQLRTDLRALKQTGSVTAYSSAFMKIMGDLNIDMLDLIYQYQVGLNEAYRRELSKNEYVDVMDLIRAATRMEQNEFSTTKTSQVLSIEEKQRKQVICNFCKKQGHIAKDCYSKKRAQQNADKANGQGNRSASNQGDPKTSQGAQRQNTGTQEQRPKQDERRDNQSKEQRGQRDNRQRRKQSYANPYNQQAKMIETVKEEPTLTNAVESFQMIRAPKIQHAMVVDHALVKIDAVVGASPCRAFIDSGATTSVMSAYYARTANLVIEPSPIMVKYADGIARPVVGVVNNVAVVVGESVCTLSFLVIKSRDYSVILGLNWLRESGASLCVQQNAIYFPRSTLSILPDDPDPLLDACMLQDMDDTDDLTGLTTEWTWEGNEKASIKLLRQLSKDEERQFSPIASLISRLTASSYDQLGSCKVRSHAIHLSTERPIYIAPFRIPESDRKLLDAELTRLLNAGIIRRSTSPWGSRAFFVGKKDSSKRLVVDFKPLNAYMYPLHWPIPNVQDIFDSMSGARFFSKLDLKSGYYQVLMDDQSIRYTAFTTPLGHFEFIRMPFGLRNAPAEFCKIMQDVLGDLPFVRVYLDDITVFSRTFAEHCKHLLIVLKRLEQYDLRINLTKCEFLRSTISLLGHVVGQDLIKMDPALVDSIKQRQPPNNLQALQSFLGLTNYYRRFIKGYADIAHPLTRLLKKSVAWDWSSQHDDSFNKLKQALTSFPVLRMPDFTKPFVLCCDASGYAVGAVLQQSDEKNSEYVVAYASRTLKGAECSFGVTEKECLAVVFGIKQFHIYLYGTKFELRTDHAALKWLRTISDPTSRLARWSLFLQAYDFSITHVKGTANANADALSRPVVAMAISTKIPFEWYDDAPLMHFLKHHTHVPGIDRERSYQVQGRSTRLSLEGDLLHYHPDENTSLIVPRPDDRKRTIEIAHTSGAHFGVVSTVARLKSKYHWPHMQRDVEYHIQRCRTCLRNKNFSMHSLAKVIQVENVFDQVGMDLQFGYPDSPRGNIGLMVITEYVSKYAMAFPIKSKTAEEIFRCFQTYCCLFGPPKRILTDCGKEFLNEILTKFTTAIGVVHLHTSAYHPQTNGLVERFNATLATALRSLAEQHKSDWDLFIPTAIWAYNTRTHSTTGTSPYSLMFGREMTTFDDWSPPIPPSEHQLALEVRQHQIRELFDTTIPAIRQKVKDKQLKQQEAQNRRHRIVKSTPKVGDTCYARIDSMKNKLEPRFNGPYQITEVTRLGNFKLKDATGTAVAGSFPLDKLKLFTDIEQFNANAEVAEILDDRTENNKTSYKVKWADGSGFEWVTEDDFNAVELLNRYWAEKKGKDYAPMTRPRGRPRTVQVLNLSLMQILALLFLILPLVASLRIDNTDGRFEVCESTSLSQQVNLNTPCDRSSRTSELPLDLRSTIETVHLLARDRHQVHGYGFQCTKQIIVSWFNTSFTTATSSNTYYANVVVGANECREMATSRICNGHPMTCEENACSIEQLPEPNYQWWKDVQLLGYKCKVTKKLILAEDLLTPLFGKVAQPCLATDFVCFLSDSTVIWDRSIVHQCPLKYVHSLHNVSFFHQLNLISSPDNNILLKISKQQKQCDMVTNVTTEGFFTTIDKRALNFNYSGLDIDISGQQSLNNLLFSELDQESFKTSLLQVSLEQQIDSLDCAISKNLFALFKSFNDRFFRFKHRSNKSTILYAKNEALFIPHCQTVTSMDINTFTGDNKQFSCDKYVKIRFTLNGTNESGFLNEDYVISRQSPRIECQKISYSQHLVNNTFIGRTGASSYFFEKGLGVEIPLSIHHGSLDLNFKHLDFSADHPDVLDILHKQNTFLLEPFSKSLANLLETHIRSEASGLFDMLTAWRFWLTISVSLSISIALFVAILRCYVRWPVGHYCGITRLACCKKNNVNSVIQLNEILTEQRIQQQLLVQQPQQLLDQQPLLLQPNQQVQQSQV